MKELIILKESKGITKSKDLFKKIQKINIDFKQENLLVFYLDSKNAVIKSEVLFKGGLNSSVVCLKTLFRQALKYNSNSLIVAHNHPSNDLNPSVEDLEINNRIKDAGKIIDLNLLDFIIFNKIEYYSVTDKERGL